MGKLVKEYRHRRGRPSKLTRILQETICQYILQGKDIEEAIRDAGVSRTSLWRYRKNSAFARALDEASNRYWEEEGERFLAEIKEEMINETKILPWKKWRRQRKRLTSSERKRRFERCRDARGRFSKSE